MNRMKHHATRVLPWQRKSLKILVVDQVELPPELKLVHRIRVVLLIYYTRVLPMSMDTAIEGIVSTIVERTVSIATQTTMEIVLKEYCTEPDETLIHKASCMLVFYVAGNLSYITWKEPLRNSIATELRNSVQGLNVASEFLELAMQRVIDDNLEFGCASIEKAATEKGLVVLKKELSQQLLIRRKHREASRPATFDPNLIAQGNIGPQQQVYKVLFKKFGVDMKAVTPTSLLKDRDRIIKGNPDFSKRGIVEEDNPIRKSAISYQVEIPPEAATGPLYQGGPSNILYQLPTPTSNNPEVNLLYLKTHFQRVLPLSMDKSIEGIGSTIVDRNVSIATTTTMELDIKDYFTEPDENCVHSASCMLVCLAGNLSYITCKEPLRNLMSTELRNMVQGLNVASEFLELTMQRVIEYNLESGCASIEKAATKKGLILVQKELSQHLSIRRKRRESSRPADPTLIAEGKIGPQQQVYKLLANSIKHARVPSFISAYTFPESTSNGYG